MNDDMRQLKDTKLAISEKNVPKSIKILKRTMIVAMIIVIGLAGTLNPHLQVFNNISIQPLRLEWEAHIKLISLVASQGLLTPTNVPPFSQTFCSTLGVSNYLQRNSNIFSSSDLIAYKLCSGLLLDTTPPSVEADIKSRLITLIDDLQTTQFNVIKADIAVNSDSNNTNYTIINLMQDNTNQTQQTTYDDSLFQFITSASSVRNSTLSSFNNTSTVDSTKKNFFYVNYNGLRPLRWGSENIALSFYDYYYDRTGTYRLTIEIFMICALIAILVSQFIIVPFVFTVQKTNNRVLSLFGYIPSADLHLLADKCEKYLDIYLEDRDEKRDDSYEASQDEGDEGDEDANGYEEGDEENESMQKSQNSFNQGSPDEINQTSGGMNVSQATEGNGVETKMALYKDSPQKQTPDNNGVSMKESAKGLTVQTLKVPEKMNSSQQLNNSRMDRSRMNTSRMNKSKGRGSKNKIDGSRMDVSKMEGSKSEIEKKSEIAPQPTDKPKHDSVMHMRAMEEKLEQEADAFLERSQKLLNSKDNNRLKVIIQFSIFALLYMAYFAIDFGTEVLYINNVRNAYVHLRQILERPADLKFVNVFAQEEIALQAPLYIEGD